MAMGRTAAAAPLGPSRSSPAKGRSKPRRASVHTTAPPPTDDSVTAEARARVEPSCGVLAHGTAAAGRPGPTHPEPRVACPRSKPGAYGQGERRWGVALPDGYSETRWPGGQAWLAWLQQRRLLAMLAWLPAAASAPTARHTRMASSCFYAHHARHAWSAAASAPRTRDTHGQARQS